MKISNCLIAFAAVAIGAGCRSGETHHVATTTTTTRRVTVQAAPPQQEANTSSAPQQGPGVVVAQGSNSNFDYRVEMIPNSRLSATSREGDNSKTIYSSNIIGVYVHPHNAATNAPAAPIPGDNSAPE